MRETVMIQATFNRICLYLVLLQPALALAQPADGPWGPVQRSYDIPDSGTVYYVAPDGQADAKGTSLNQPTTLESAIARVVTGDAVILRGGVYRTGSLLLNQGVTIQPYADERPMLKGTRIASEWEALRDGVWRTQWSTLFPAAPLGWWRREREGMRTPLHRFNNDQLFIDGRLLKSAGWAGELDQDSYFIDYEKGYVYIGIDPVGKTVEITAHDNALVRTAQDVHGKSNDRKGPLIRGLEITQYAYRCLEVEGEKQFTMHDEPTDDPVGLADPDTFGKQVIGTVLEDLTISFCSRVAGYFRGDGLVIRNTLVSDTGTEGIYVIGSSDVLLERNIIRRNNVEQLTGYYASAVKIFNQTRRVVFRNNLITEQPHSNGVWYDVGNRDGVIINNWIEDTEDGFFFEISRGAVVAGNVFRNNHKGVRVLNAADVEVYNNTFINNPASFERNERSKVGDHFGWHTSTGPDVDEREGHVFVNNLLVADASFGRPLLQFEQPASLCKQLNKPMATRVDGNVYSRPEGDAPVVRLSPAGTESCVEDVSTLELVRQRMPVWEAQGRQLNLGLRRVFTNPDLGHYHLQQALDGNGDSLVPASVHQLLGWSAAQARTPGAYPVSP
jgi:parallel beta-helix repeat protein